MSSLEKGSSQGKFIYGLWTKSDLIPLISVHLPLDLHPVMVDVKGKSLGLNSLSLVPARCVPRHVPCPNPLLKSSTASTQSIKLLLLGVVRTFLFFALQDIGVLFESWAVHVADSLAGNMRLDLHQLECEDNIECEQTATGLLRGEGTEWGIEVCPALNSAHTQGFQCQQRSPPWPRGNFAVSKFLREICLWVFVLIRVLMMDHSFWIK